MKYEVGQKLTATCDHYLAGEKCFSFGRDYEIVETSDGAIRFIDDTGGRYAVIFSDIKEIFGPIEKQRTTEQQDYLDKCAIAAMQGIVANPQLTDFLRGNDARPVPLLVAGLAEQISEAMLAERERRAKL